MYFENEGQEASLLSAKDEMYEGNDRGMFGDESDIYIPEDANEDSMDSIDDQLYEDRFMDDFDKVMMREMNDYAESAEKQDSDVPACSIEQAVMDFRSGAEEAFNYIYKSYESKFERLGKRRNDDELSQELSLVLLKAIETFNINGGAKFNTYFWKCANNHMGTLKIRRDAKKRTAEFGVVSMQQHFSAKDSDVEMEAFIEDKNSEKSYDNKIFEMVLEENVYPYLKSDEIVAIKMFMQNYTLEEIGNALGGITAPAVHVKLRRLANKKNVGKQLRALYELLSA